MFTIILVHHEIAKSESFNLYLSNMILGNAMTYDYQYPPRTELDLDAGIIHRYVSENFKAPLSVTMSPQAVIVVFDVELSASEKEQLDKVMAMTMTPTEDEKYLRAESEFASITWAEVDSIDMPNKRIVVKRVIDGKEFKRSCLVSWSIKEAYAKGELTIGDKVIIGFKPLKITEAVVLDKIVM